jgi:hypothetical protein
MLKIKRDEQGSLVIAVTVMMVLVLFSIALVARSTGAVDNVRTSQNISTALSAADEGVAEAIFKIDQEQSADFNGSGTSNGNTYYYKAIKVDNDTWTVRGKGIVNGTPHAVQVTVSRIEEYPYAIFSAQQLRFNGNGGPNVTSWNSSTGQTNTHHAKIGSNHAIVINGGGGGDEQDYYTPDGSCSGCANGVQKQGPLTYPDPIAPTTGIQACPANGSFGNSINGANGTPFVCNHDVTFASGNVTVTNGPVIIYVTANYAVTLSDVNINTNGSGGNFRLLKAGTGNLNIGNGSHAPNINGVIYAPSSSMTVNGGQITISGSLVVNSITINGNPNFTLTYDDALNTITSTGWTQSNWSEIPSTSY